MTNLTTQALLCALGAFLASACGETEGTVFPARDQNVGASGGSTGGNGGSSEGGMGGMSAGSGGMITAGSAGMGMGAAGHPMDAGADEDAAVDAGQLADAGADAAVVAPTPAEICAAYCQSKQDFIGGGSSSTCGSLDNSSCQNDCAVALQNTPVPCNLRLGELFACQTAAADYVCTTGGNDPTVDQNTGVCPDENVGIQTCVPDGS